MRAADHRTVRARVRATCAEPEGEFLTAVGARDSVRAELVAEACELDLTTQQTIREYAEGR